MKTILVDAVNTSITKDETGNFVQNKALFELLEIYPNPKLIVTNANDEQMIQFGLNAVPYPVFTMKHNPDKPDQIYFKTLLEQYNFTTSDVVYFEHNPDAVTSAKSVGITTYNYDKDAKDLVALKDFLDSNLEN
jgi:HAD superfamily hydrolase (TIGR01509 family)